MRRLLPLALAGLLAISLINTPIQSNNPTPIRPQQGWGYVTKIGLYELIESLHQLSFCRTCDEDAWFYDPLSRKAWDIGFDETRDSVMIDHNILSHYQGNAPIFIVHFHTTLEDREVCFPPSPSDVKTSTRLRERYPNVNLRSVVVATCGYFEFVGFDPPSCVDEGILNSYLNFYNEFISTSSDGERREILERYGRRIAPNTYEVVFGNRRCGFSITVHMSPIESSNR